MEGSRFSLWALLFMTLASTLGFASVVIMIDPQYAQTSALIALYASFFMTITSITSWFFMLTRGYFGRVKRPLNYFFSDALRQGAIIALLFTASLFLQAKKELTFIAAFMLIVFSFAFEALIIKLKSKN